METNDRVDDLRRYSPDLSHREMLFRPPCDMSTLTVSEIQPSTRLKSPQAAGEIYRAMKALQNAVDRCSLDARLLDLVKLRASQINGCAFCIDMHFRDALKGGERIDRLYLLDAWREVGLYSARERAALAWAEEMTRLSSGDGVSDVTFEAASAVFTETELFELTLAIIAINGWNRLNVGFRVPPAAA